MSETLVGDVAVDHLRDGTTVPTPSIIAMSLAVVNKFVNNLNCWASVDQSPVNKNAWACAYALMRNDVASRIQIRLK